MFIHRLKKMPQEMADFIHSAGRMADELGVGIYLVGGFVRDLFLGVENFDIDFVIEADAIAFALDLARKYDLKVIAHRRFGTATLEGLEGFKVDMATARKETYEKPAVLPVVSFGRIEDDLFRRDFTINAMAVCINIHDFGKLIDLYDGHSDLRHGLIRALHSFSFIDDPTRILRAIRFEQRFNFKIEKMTFGWIRDAVRKGMLRLVQKHRLRDELVLIFKEKLPSKCLRRLYEICGYSYISVSLKYQRSWDKVFEEIRVKFLWFKERLPHRRHLELYCLYMSFFFVKVPLKELKKVISEFAFHKGESSRMLVLVENYAKIDKELSCKDIPFSRIFTLLEPINYETIILISILSNKRIVRERIERFLCSHNGSRIHLRGEDLEELGIKPGPVFKKILRELLHAKIDGHVNTKEDELKLAKKIIEHL